MEKQKCGGGITIDYMAVTVGCGGETVEQDAEKRGEAFLRKAQALSEEHPVVLGRDRDCDGRLTFAKTLPAVSAA